MHPLSRSVAEMSQRFPSMAPSCAPDVIILASDTSLYIAIDGNLTVEAHPLRTMRVAPSSPPRVSDNSRSANRGERQDQAVAKHESSRVSIWLTDGSRGAKMPSLWGFTRSVGHGPFQPPGPHGREVGRVIEWTNDREATIHREEWKR